MSNSVMVLVFPFFYFCYACARVSKRTFISFRAHVNISFRVVSYRRSIPGTKADVDRWRTHCGACPSIAFVGADVQAGCQGICPACAAVSRTSVRWRWWWRAGIRPPHSRVERRRRPRRAGSAEDRLELLPVVSEETEARTTRDERCWNRRRCSHTCCAHARTKQCTNMSHFVNYNNNKLAPYGTGGRLLLTANFKVTWHRN